ncbi:MAG TPA: hypothetical protein VFC56_12345 [Stellaceae bacterium]|nr:hypothetical protein [Stellaceae bacterium]
MKLGILGAALVLALPLSAMAQTLPQQKADLEEALRLKQFICNGIADVSARGAGDYASGDLARCREALGAQRAEYQAFMAQYASAQVAASPAAAATSHTTFADAAH